jgi:hypothetical protein
MKVLKLKHKKNSKVDSGLNNDFTLQKLSSVTSKTNIERSYVFSSLKIYDDTKKNTLEEKLNNLNEKVKEIGIGFHKQINLQQTPHKSKSPKKKTYISPNGSPRKGLSVDFQRTVIRKLLYNSPDQNRVMIDSMINGRGSVELPSEFRTRLKTIKQYETEGLTKIRKKIKKQRQSSIIENLNIRSSFKKNSLQLNLSKRTSENTEKKRKSDKNIIQISETINTEEPKYILSEPEVPAFKILKFSSDNWEVANKMNKRKSENLLLNKLEIKLQNGEKMNETSENNKESCSIKENSKVLQYNKMNFFTPQIPLKSKNVIALNSFRLAGNLQTDEYILNNETQRNKEKFLFSSTTNSIEVEDKNYDYLETNIPLCTSPNFTNKIKNNSIFQKSPNLTFTDQKLHSKLHFRMSSQSNSIIFPNVLCQTKGNFNKSKVYSIDKTNRFFAVSEEAEANNKELSCKIKKNVFIMNKTMNNLHPKTHENEEDRKMLLNIYGKKKDTAPFIYYDSQKKGGLKVKSKKQDMLTNIDDIAAYRIRNIIIQKFGITSTPSDAFHIYDKIKNDVHFEEKSDKHEKVRELLYQIGNKKRKIMNKISNLKTSYAK